MNWVEHEVGLSVVDGLIVVGCGKEEGDAVQVLSTLSSLHGWIRLRIHFDWICSISC